MNSTEMIGGPIAGAIASPPPREVETFRFLATVFDVGKAQRLIEGQVPDSSISVPGIIAAQGGFVHHDEDRLNDDAIDLNQGIILCPVFETGPLASPRSKGRGPKKPVQQEDEAPILYLVIDGWHRIRKADRLGVEWLPVHVLTSEQGRGVRIR